MSQVGRMRGLATSMGLSGRSCRVPTFTPLPKRTETEDIDDLSAIERTAMAASAIASGAPSFDAVRTFDASTMTMRAAEQDIDWHAPITALDDIDYYGEIEAHLRAGRPRRNSTEPTP